MGDLSTGAGADGAPQVPVLPLPPLLKLQTPASAADALANAYEHRFVWRTRNDELVELSVSRAHLHAALTLAAQSDVSATAAALAAVIPWTARCRLPIDRTPPAAPAPAAAAAAANGKAAAPVAANTPSPSPTLSLPSRHLWHPAAPEWTYDTHTQQLLYVDVRHWTLNALHQQSSSVIVLSPKQYPLLASIYGAELYTLRDARTGAQRLLLAGFSSAARRNRALFGLADGSAAGDVRSPRAAAAGGTTGSVSRSGGSANGLLSSTTRRASADEKYPRPDGAAADDEEDDSVSSGEHRDRVLEIVTHPPLSFVAGAPLSTPDRTAQVAARVCACPDYRALNEARCVSGDEYGPYAYPAQGAVPLSASLVPSPHLTQVDVALNATSTAGASAEPDTAESAPPSTRALLHVLTECLPAEFAVRPLATSLGPAPNTLIALYCRVPSPLCFLMTTAAAAAPAPAAAAVATLAPPAALLAPPAALLTPPAVPLVPALPPVIPTPEDVELPPGAVVRADMKVYGADGTVLGSLLSEDELAADAPVATTTTVVTAAPAAVPLASAAAAAPTLSTTTGADASGVVHVVDAATGRVLQTCHPAFLAAKREIERNGGNPTLTTTGAGTTTASVALNLESRRAVFSPDGRYYAIYSYAVDTQDDDTTAADAASGSSGANSNSTSEWLTLVDVTSGAVKQITLHRPDSVFVAAGSPTSSERRRRVSMVAAVNVPRSRFWFSAYPDSRYLYYLDRNKAGDGFDLLKGDLVAGLRTRHPLPEPPVALTLSEMAQADGRRFALERADALNEKLAIKLARRALKRDLRALFAAANQKAKSKAQGKTAKRSDRSGDDSDDDDGSSNIVWEKRARVLASRVSELYLVAVSMTQWPRKVAPGGAAAPRTPAAMEFCSYTRLAVVVLPSFWAGHRDFGPDSGVVAPDTPLVLRISACEANAPAPGASGVAAAAASALPHVLEHIQCVYVPPATSR